MTILSQQTASPGQPPPLVIEPALTILIVEDCLEDRVLYRRLLDRNAAGFEVLEADSVAAGLALSREHAVDCIVLDYHLPDADGIDSIEVFQQQSRKQQTAIIMVTGQGNEKTAVEAMKLGALDYINKNSISEGYFVQAILNAIERARLKQQILTYQHDLEQSNQALSEFSHIVSHDLKAPLRRIASYCELLEEETHGQLSADAANYVRRMVTNAARLQRFIDDLLAFSRVMHAEEEMEKTPLNKLVGEVLEDLEPLIEENQARVTVDALPLLLVYPMRIRQVFLNLLSNAIKYRGKDTPVIHVSARDEGDRYRFLVTDNGMGIPAAYQKNIFKAFQRLHAHDAIEGTGLGLSIVEKVIGMHKGEAGVMSEAGKGATFFFTIPKRRTDEEVTQ